MTADAACADALEALIAALSHAHLVLDAEGWEALDAARRALREAGRRDAYMEGP